MSPLWNAVEVAWHADGSLWISVNAWALPVVILVLVMSSRSAPWLLRTCFGKRVEYLFALLVVIVAVAGRAGLVVPAPQLGKVIDGKLYSINASQFRASRGSWFAGEGSNSVEYIHAAADQLVSTFVLSEKDDDTDQFLTRCAEAGQSWAGRVTVHVKHKVYHALQEFLGWSRTDASAFVDRATMYVASKGQLRRLFEQARNRTAIAAEHRRAAAAEVPGPRPATPRALLDIGAGTGSVTEILASSAGVAPEGVHALEVSAPLRRSLAARGYHAAQDFASLSAGVVQRFDVISLLNVLDRSDDPQFLIESAYERLHPDGFFLVATVLPFCGSVYQGRRGKRSNMRAPRTPLRVHPAATCRNATSFEIAAAAFVAEAFASRLMKVLAWTRLPYLSSGDTKRTHYKLDMAVFVLQRQSISPTNEAPVPGVVSALREAPHQCKALGKIPRSSIYKWLSSTIDSLGAQSWGDVLDAGTGFGSLCWLLHQRYQTLTGVTAEEGSGIYGHSSLQDLISSASANGTSILRGNWRDEQLLLGREYDIVVADYLLGAVERYWPYGADDMLDRVLHAVKPGGHLLIVGLEPYELVLDAKADRKDAVVLEVEALGDVAALLGGSPSYRELPEDWVARHVRRRGGFRVVARRQFPMKHGGQFVKSQLDFARRESRKIADKGLRDALRRRVKALRVEEKNLGTHDRAHNYAIVVKRE